MQTLGRREHFMVKAEYGMRGLARKTEEAISSIYR